MSAVEPNCFEVQSSLPLYVGSDLEPAQLARVRKHLDSCRACSREQLAAESARAVLLEVRDSIDSESIDLWPTLRAQLAREGLLAPARVKSARERDGVPIPADPRSRPTQRPFALGRRALAWLPAAAAAVLLVVVLRGRGDSELGSPGGTPIAEDNPALVPSVGGELVLGPTAIEVTPVSTGLRRADPAEERLRDRARMLPIDGLAPRALGRSQDGSSFAGDSSLR